MVKLLRLGAVLCLGLFSNSMQATEFLEPIEFKSPYEDLDDSLGLDALDSAEVSFTNEGLAFLNYLEERIKDAKASQMSSRGLGAGLVGVGIGLAPVTLGLSLLYTGVAPIFIAHGEGLKKDLNGWRLIKASYVHCGYKNPNEDKLKKHDDRIEHFIKKYLKMDTDAQTVDRVAKAIVMANEKGWFGMIYNDSIIFRQNNFRRDIGKRLFTENGINASLMSDTTVAEKISKYAVARKEYQEKRQEIMENV